MATSMGLPNGPYPLTTDGVTAAVTVKSPGAYVLGEKNSSDGVFYITYAGRSDDDVANRLKQHVLEPEKQFHFAYYATPKEAHAKECWLYHTFNPPKNVIHPAKPKGSSLACPQCGFAG